MFLAAQSMAVGTVMVRWVSKYSDPIMATGWVGSTIQVISYKVTSVFLLMHFVKQISLVMTFCLPYSNVYDHTIERKLVFNLPLARWLSREISCPLQLTNYVMILKISTEL